jgi:heterodisulfide reductase subunit A-like polyferredoxin
MSKPKFKLDQEVYIVRQTFPTYVEIVRAIICSVTEIKLEDYPIIYEYGFDHHTISDKNIRETQVFSLKDKKKAIMLAKECAEDNLKRLRLEMKANEKYVEQLDSWDGKTMISSDLEEMLG